MAKTAKKTPAKKATAKKAAATRPFRDVHPLGSVFHARTA